MAGPAVEFADEVCGDTVGDAAKRLSKLSRGRSKKMKNDKQRRKMIMPIVITVVFLLYLTGYGTAIVAATEWSPVMILIAIPLVALGIGMIVALKSRIKEIRSGEEDDLSNY